MYSPFSPEENPASKEVKQRITKKLSGCIRSLQIRYVTTDDVVTSEDDDANGLCIALEAAFIHGLKPKFVKFRGHRRGTHIPIPQPAFWSLLKAITHRDVIKEIESVKFLSNDVGRCRSWIRLALIDGLLECYFISLRREKNRLMDYYQPCALLLDEEDCDVVLSYLQGLASLIFDLSYKSALLCDWTATPLVLSGLWVEDGQQLSISPQEPVRRKSQESMCQSSSSEDTNSSMLQDSKETNEASSMSIDTNSSSSRLSSSAGSDGQPNAQGNTTPTQPGSPELSSGETSTTDTKAPLPPQTENSDLDISPVPDKTFFSPILNDSFQEGIRFTTDTLRTLYLKCGSKTTEPKPHDPSAPAKSLTRNSITNIKESNEDIEDPPSPWKIPETESIDPFYAYKPMNSPPKCPFTEIPKSKSWISEDDFHCPKLVVERPPANQSSTDSDQSPKQPSKIIHRRHKGLPNPFRGLLLMGCLERKNGLGLYKSFYCELTPYEFRIFVKNDRDDDERICLENCSLLRCETVGLAQSDGCFELQFSGKKLCMRAASQDEAQDWVERLQEAVMVFRPPQDEDWEILDPNSPLDPENKSSSVKVAVNHPVLFCWVSPFEAEPDALKESILYMKIQKRWTQFIFSLSERILRCFIPKPAEKMLYETYSIEMMRDILPDTSLGSASCFRLVTSKGTLQLQAETPREAKAWRELVRAAYLEWEEDSAFVPGEGNFHIKSVIREHHLFKFLMYIPGDRGLDCQDFKCAGCNIKIGVLKKKAKICAFSSLYYCSDCHQDQTTIIPARIVHNWDSTERVVSQHAINFLNMVYNEPLFNVQYLNDSLYIHTRIMYEMRYDRERLRLLAEYLRTCRSEAPRELLKGLDNRGYLLDCIHTYSFWDLKQVINGVFETKLHRVLLWAMEHVYKCSVCSQKGFICPICNKDEIIYPFQFETTSRCSDCKAVFHIHCKMEKKPCPSCKKRKKVQNQCFKM
uniref:Pleckstrin homology and RUN domain containing M1 n=1 Tax=Leptobrachium leishanense TaxID=445787 RepID=A0A8C5PCK6_9ANUR